MNQRMFNVNSTLYVQRVPEEQIVSFKIRPGFTKASIIKKTGNNKCRSLLQKWWKHVEMKPGGPCIYILTLWKGT